MHVIWLLTFAICGGTIATNSAASSAILEHSLDAQLYDEQARDAGATLYDLASTDSLNGRRGLTPYEIFELQECFQLGGEGSIFTSFYKDAVRAAVSTRNTDTLRFLHENYPSKDLLANEFDVLQLALETYGRRHYLDQYSEADLDTFKILLAYGAPVNGVDADGNTALFYACVHGWPNVFEVLIDAGADLSGQYTVRVEGWKQGWLKTLGFGEKVSLLQVTANALYDAYDTENIGYVLRPQYAYVKWQPIINSLVEKDFTIPSNHPATAVVIKLACDEGTKNEAETILSKGVGIEAAQKFVGSSKSTLTPALHAAVMIGHTEMAELLLKKGADPNATMPHSDRYGLQLKSTSRTAVAQACLSPYSNTGFLDACTPLLEAGIGIEDQRLMLAAAIKHGQYYSVARLVENGVMLGEVPVTSSLAVLKYLHEKEFPIDPVKSQEYAVRIGSTEMLAWLVDVYGPQLKDVSDLYHSHFEDHKYGDPSNVTEYLVREYGHNADGTYQVHARISRGVLEYVARPERHDLLKRLLRLGNDAQCPGIRASANEILKFRLRDGRGWSSGGPSRGDVLVMQTLLQFAEIAEGAASHESERLWLRPSMLPEHLAEEPQAEKQSVSGYSWRPRDAMRNLSIPAGDGSLMGEPHVVTEGISAFATPSRYDGHSNEEQSGGRKHERTEYTKLPSRDSIRLFLLEPAVDEDQHISGSLVDTRLKEKPEYELLSYAASETNDMVDISIDGMARSVTRDLHSALVRLRTANGPRALWVDAICINQEDIEERKQQSNIKKQIIESARSTLVWLGETADDSHLIFEHVKNWITYRNDYLAGRTTDNDDFGEAHINPPTYGNESLAALNRLILRPWFLDARALGELTFSREAYMMCGDHIVDFDMLALPLSFEVGSGYHPLRGLDGSTHLHLLDEIVSQRRGCNVKALVDYISHCDAPDPRDKVFALLDFLPKPPIPVDYALTVEEVYRRFTQALLEDANDISLLHWLGPHRQIQSLPSWAPDYSITQPGMTLPRVNRFSHTVTEASRLLREALPGMRFEGDKMIIRGAHVDTIKTVSEEMIADLTNAPGKPGFTNTLSKWESLATQLHSKHFNESVSSAFLRTLVAFDDEPDRATDTSLAPGHASWYDRFGTGVLRDFDEQAFQEAEILLDWRGLNYQDFWEGVDVEHFTHDMERTIYGRSFFLTDSGSMGLAPPSAQPGDSIVYFPGGLYPFVLRPRGDGKYEMIGDCYLYGFDEFGFSVDEIEGFGEFVLL